MDTPTRERVDLCEIHRCPQCRDRFRWGTRSDIIGAALRADTVPRRRGVRHWQEQTPAKRARTN